jgi:hypothetical protein
VENFERRRRRRRRRRRMSRRMSRKGVVKQCTAHMY